MEQLQHIKLSFKCPKQLNELQPCNGGWYCDGCRKIVHDFRGMSEEQILAAFAKNNNHLCGMFEAGRIEVLPQQNKWRKWASAAMMFLGITAWYQRIYAQVSTPVNTTSVKADTSTHPLVGAIATPDPDAFAGMAILPAPKLPEDLKPPVDNVFFGRVGTDPKFPGGEAALRKYLYGHIKYTGGFTGRVYVQFTVEKNGSLTHIMILRGGNKDAEDQVVNAVKLMPKWNPGMQNGKPVQMQYTLPVSFLK